MSASYSMQATDADGLDDYVSDDETTAPQNPPRDSATQHEDERDEDLYGSATQYSGRDPVQRTFPAEDPTQETDPSLSRAAEDLLSNVAADIKGKGKARDMDPPPPTIPSIHSPEDSDAEDDLQIPGFSRNRSHRVFSLDPAFETQESTAGPSRLAAVDVTADQGDIYRDQSTPWSRLSHRAAQQEPEPSGSPWWQDTQTTGGFVDLDEPPAPTSESSHPGPQNPSLVPPPSNLESTSSQQWEQWPSPAHSSFPQQQGAPSDDNDLPMEEGASDSGDIQMSDVVLEEDYPMYDDEGYTCEQIFGSGVHIPDGNFGEAVWIQVQQYFLQQQLLQQQEFQHEQQTLHEELYRQQEIQRLERQQYEAQMAAIWENSPEGRLERANRFWNSIPALPRPATVTPPAVASYTAPPPPSESTQTTEKSAARREYKRMMDRENVDRDLRRQFPYAIAAALGPSKFASLQRSLQDLSTPYMDPQLLYRRSFRPAPPSNPFSKKSVPTPRPANSRIYGTPAVRKLHEEMKRARNERLARAFASSLGKRRAGDSDNSDADDDTLESPSKRTRVDLNLPASPSTHNNGDISSKKHSRKTSKPSSSKPTYKPKASASVRKAVSMQRRVRDARAPSPPSLPPTPSSSNAFLPVESLNSEVVSPERASRYPLAHRAAAIQNDVYKAANRPLHSAIRQPSAAPASSKRSQKKVAFVLPDFEDPEDSSTDSGDDTSDERDATVVKTRICAGFLSSIAGMFRFGRLR